MLATSASPTTEPTPPDAPRLVLDAETIERALRRMALQIAEHTAAQGHVLAIVGIHTRGVEIARRLVNHLTESGDHPAFGTLDVSMHRDDLRQRAPAALLGSVHTTDLPLDLDDRTVILVDDVFFTGRSARAALDALNTYGRPRAVHLAVLVDRRGHRELPIRPDYAGAKVATTPAERVRVRFAALDGVADGVWVVSGQQA